MLFLSFDCKPKTAAFELGDIRPGYVVKFRNGNLRLVAEAGEKSLHILVDPVERDWLYKCMWNRDLTCLGEDRDRDIVEVWGCVKEGDYANALTATTEGRELLWKRPEPRKMTLAEIGDALGYEVQVVEKNENPQY